jgi:hypothetical protein
MAHLNMHTSKKKKTHNITIPVMAKVTPLHVYAGTDGRKRYSTNLFTTWHQHHTPGTLPWVESWYPLHGR